MTSRARTQATGDDFDIKTAKVIRRGPRPGKAPTQLTLREMREGAAVTQAALAERMGKDQAEISRLERREDTSVSTLREYATALGAKVEIVFTFSRGHRILLKV